MPRMAAGGMVSGGRAQRDGHNRTSALRYCRTMVVSELARAAALNSRLPWLHSSAYSFW